MESDVRRISRVPSHLKPFHRRPQPKTPVRSLRATKPSKSSPPELCPPHWRIDSHQSWRTLFKIWKVEEESHTRCPEVQHKRPPMGRMKDSDDYITARAANPWTGLISPSPGTQTPCTPDSPAEALSLSRTRATQQDSPTHTVKRRPVLATGNDGRKPSGGHERISALEGVLQAQGRDKLLDDRFIVHMPSAREPQPFAYPGYTPEQIAALEHYRSKARRVSSEGYDRRLFHDKPMAICAHKEHHEVHDEYVHPPHHSYYHHRDHEPTSSEPPRIVVRKRENSKMGSISQRGQTSNPSPICDQEFSSPISGPRSPKPSVISAVDKKFNNSVQTKSHESTKDAEQRSATDAGNKADLTHFKVCPDKPIQNLAPRRGAEGCDQSSSCVSHLAHRQRPPDSRSTSWDIVSTLPGAFTEIHLSRHHRSLPRVQRLVEKRERATALTMQEQRQCSLGCERDEDEGGICVPKQRARVTSSGTVVIRPSFSSSSTSSLFAPSPPSPTRRQRVKLDGAFLLTYSLLSLRYLGSLQIPRIAVLLDPEVSMDDKVDALKTLLSFASHAFAVAALTALMWKLGTSLVVLMQCILWPIFVPARVLGWVLVGW